MITFWGFVLGLPLLAFGGVSVISPAAARAFATWFRGNRVVAAVLTVAAWLWTAFECNTIGIDIFDQLLLKEKSGGIFVWALALVLSYLTFIWMPKNLPVRALCGLLMLVPAELFKATRPLLPASGFGAVQIMVAVAYLGAIAGMYGMFYPWRLEKALELVLARGGAAKAFGLFCSALGLATVIVGCVK